MGHNRINTFYFLKSTNMKNYTKEERKEYFNKLRASWQASKKLAETDKYKAIIAEVHATGLNVSAYGICYIWEQMERLGLKGLPHIDAKTFNGWRNSGFKVKKGEKAKLHGITFAKPKNEEDETDFTFPKNYALFHISQVENI